MPLEVWRHARTGKYVRVHLTDDGRVLRATHATDTVAAALDALLWFNRADAIEHARRHYARVEQEV